MSVISFDPTQGRRKPRRGLGLHFAALFEFFVLVYHSTVQDIRKTDGNAIRGLLKEILQSVVMVVVFYFMFEILGMRGVAIRGNYILYILSGIFMFMTHVKSMGKVVGTGGPLNPMLQHRPLTTFIQITAAALSVLYTQVLAMGFIVFFTHVVVEPVEIYNKSMLAGVFLLAWFSGVALGLLLLALQAFFPTVIMIVMQLYQRANMIFSGKMFVASSMPGYMLAMFTWNPLFHIIDQGRGAMFVNYTARVTNLTYPIVMTFLFLVLGLIVEHASRKYASQSWSARR